MAGEQGSKSGSEPVPGRPYPAISLEEGLAPLRDTDRSLAAELSDILASHVSLRDLPLAFVIRGGVVHLRGAVPSPGVRCLVRRVIGRLRGVHAVWDTLLVDGDSSITVADIGCGGHKQIPWATGVDRHPLPGVDIVADLENGLPFTDDAVDHVYAVHFLEHVRNLVQLMNEVHRCLKPDGVLHVMVPNCLSVNAVADPTHVRLFNTQSFKYFCTPSPEVRIFRPLIVSADRENILADLQPVKAGRQPPEALELSRYFD